MDLPGFHSGRFLVFIVKKALPPEMLNRFLAAFQNPEFLQGTSNAALDFRQTACHRLRDSTDDPAGSGREGHAE
jgi:hypothetical protein